MLTVIAAIALLALMENTAPPATQPATDEAALDRELTPEDQEAAENLSAEGWLLWQKRDLPAAEEKFKQAVEHNPLLANAWNGLGWCRSNMGKTIGAEKAFNECIRLEPTHAAALNGLGWIAYGRNELQAAEKYWLGAVDAAPNASAAWWGLAKLYLIHSEWDKARKWTEKIVAEGLDLEGAKKLHDAAVKQELDDELRKLISPSPSAPTQASRDELKQLARARMRKDRETYSDAQLAEAERLYQVANDNWRSDEARESLRQMVEKFPDINRTGCAVLYLGQMSEGDERERLLKEAVEKYSDCFYLNGCQVGGQARLLLGQLYLQKGERQKATALFDEIRSDYPDAIRHNGDRIADQLPQFD